MFERGGGVSSISSGQVGLLHGQGAARALRRAAPAAAGTEPGERAPVAAEHGHLMDDPHPDRLISARGAAAGRRARARAPPAAAGALRAAVAAQRDRPAGLAIWRDALSEIANAVGVAYPPNALFIVGVRVRALAAAALLGGGLAPDRPVQDPRPAARAARGAPARRRARRPRRLRGGRAGAGFASRRCQARRKALTASVLRRIPRPLGAASRRRRPALAAPGRSPPRRSRALTSLRTSTTRSTWPRPGTGRRSPAGCTPTPRRSARC